jgi:UDP:flavonoid glycosyltransferase YjiC (YdhE family)
MVEQAEAAAASEHDHSTDTARERKHMGHDVPIIELNQDAPTSSTIPPPAYGDHYGAVHNEQEGFGTDAQVSDDGRVNIKIEQRNRRLSNLLAPALRRQQEYTESERPPPTVYIPPSLGGAAGVPPPPPMNVVIHVVGSRGDVQPFVALGKVLKETYCHRVRLATHPVFQDFVKENGLEFFSIGGDPAQLMAFMVKNPGLMPGFDTLRSGDVGKRRREVAEYIKGCWRSCYEAGDGMGAEATDDSIEDWTAQSTSADESERPFVAHCIIANPPSFAHIHCAEKLGIPLHIMFTMPYSPTQAFPHPLANIQASNADPHLTNYITYALIDMLTWQGLGDVINRFRQNSLGLEPVSLVWAPGMLQRLRIPHTYCWSPALIPKPKDWGQHISISGFFFLDLAANYKPPADLEAFLNAGPPPVYIGFGSIVLDDPTGMTKLIFEAVKKTGQRVLLSKGWGGVGADELGIPEGVFMLGNCPHDWLFKRVSCVVHHGGAGTTAAGITAGKPTVVVPFFGDQPFWGAMVARAGAGPQPIPHKQLTADNLAEAIEMCLLPESQQRAKELAAKIHSERGSDVGAQSFHQMLDVDKLRCNLAPSRAAVWRVRRTQVRLSALAACTLANEGLLDFNDIKLFRPREYETDEGPWDPVTGGATALVGTISTIMMGVADFPVDTLKALHIHPDAAKKKQAEEGTSSSAESTKSEGNSTRVSEDKSSSPKPARAPSMASDTAVTSGASTPATSRANSVFNLQESLAKIQSPTSPLSKEGRSNMPSSMAAALSGNLSPTTRARSRSGSRPRSRGASTAGENPIDTAMQTGKGIRKIVGAGLSSPMDFTMGLTKGFHNAPKLYGDETVRKPDQVTDFKSGVKAATKEFGYGMYDGITGLVTHPIRGAAKEGTAGFFKGIGKGIGGIALKPGAAIFGIPGYTMKGVYKEMQKQFGSSVQNYIIAARTAQGYDEWQASTPEERARIVQRWKMMQKDLKKKKNPDEMVREILEEQRRKKQDHLEKLKVGLQEKHDYLVTEWREKKRSRAVTSTGVFNHSSGSPVNDPESALLAIGADNAALEHANTVSAKELEEAEISEAIRLSVQETSRGDPKEDEEVEKAIQESMAELQKQRSKRSLHHENDRPGQMTDPSHAQAHGHPDVDEDAELERVLTQSLKEQRKMRGGGYDWDTDEDEDYQRAIRDSKKPALSPRSDEPPPAYTVEGPEHLAGTTREQFESHQSKKGEKSQQELVEERIVMEYVKKQSLLEERHRAQLRKGKAPVNEDEDEDFKRAVVASLRQGQASGS